MGKLEQEIRELAAQRDAVILAHYYVDGSLQDIADYVGDSYYLAKVAKEVPNKTVVFCGVTFMGESACILNPDKTILMPDCDAVCPMALMTDAEEVAAAREQYDDLAVVCYINSMAATKELCDVCVTSSNALRIVRNLPQKNIFFIPDQNLGSWIAEQLPEKNFIFGRGYCPIHHVIDPEDVERFKEMYPGAPVLAHPECRLEVSRLADYVGSTSGIIEYATNSPEQEFIICTESGVKHEMQKRNPGKTFHFIDKMTCDGMRNLTLQQVADCLRNNEPRAVVDEPVRLKAETCLERMLQLAEA